MSFSSDREQNFLITDSEMPSNPYDARQLLRKEYDYRALENLPGATYDEGTLQFPSNRVLLMIGNTPELTDAVNAARDAGIQMIATTDGAPLKCYCVRVKVSSWQTDSLLAVGSQRYWNATLDWSYYKDRWDVPTGANDSTYLSTLPAEQAASGTSLLGFIEDCKARKEIPA